MALVGVAGLLTLAIRSRGTLLFPYPGTSAFIPPEPLAPPPPKTLTREWEEATNARALEQKMNPISGLCLALSSLGIIFSSAYDALDVQAYHRKGTPGRASSLNRYISGPHSSLLPLTCSTFCARSWLPVSAVGEIRLTLFGYTVESVLPFFLPYLWIAKLHLPEPFVCGVYYSGARHRSCFALGR